MTNTVMVTKRKGFMRFFVRNTIMAAIFLYPAASGASALIGGIEAGEGDFPEVVYIRSAISERTSVRCSATIVGPRVILTAGHCVKDGGEIGPVSLKEIDFSLGQNLFKGTCKQAPEYRDKTEDLDLALCKVDKDIPVKWASISRNSPKLSDIVTLLGYGCIKKGGGGGNDGILRWGEAPVVKLPGGKDNWYHTKSSTTTLCSGDSGGPSYEQIKNPKSEHHWLQGVNSRGNLQDTSLLAAVFLEKSIKFFEDFAKSQNVDICGINRECAGDDDGPKVCEKEISDLTSAVDKIKECLKVSQLPYFE